MGDRSLTDMVIMAVQKSGYKKRLENKYFLTLVAHAFILFHHSKFSDEELRRPGKVHIAYRRRWRGGHPQHG